MSKRGSLEAPLVAQVSDDYEYRQGGGPEDGSNSELAVERSTTAPKTAGKRRYLVMFMTFLGLMLVYIMRVDLSIAILAMDPQFRWDQMPNDPKGFVLSSFYVGYICGQIPGGIFATKFGGNLIFGIGVLATGIFTMLLPIATCGNLECPEFTAITDAASDQTCSGGSGELMMDFFNTNMTEQECYLTCLGSCVASVEVGGDDHVVEELCLTDSKGAAQKCTANCTLDTFCDYFFFATPNSSSAPISEEGEEAAAAAVNTCSLFRSCDTSNRTMSLAGHTNQVQVTSYLPAVYALRILMGLFESVTYPSFYALLSKWAPASERGSMVGLAAGGAYFGTAIAFPICSILVASTIPVIGRWPGMFYLFGFATLVWAVAWFAVVRKSPEADKHVGEAELHWIVSTRKDDSGESKDDAAKDTLSSNEKRELSCCARLKLTIWFRMMICPASLVIFGVHFGANWINYTLLSFLPTYFSNQLNFDLSTAGFVEVIPYVVFWAMSSGSGLLLDCLVRKKCTNRLGSRKIAQALATFGPSVLLVVMGFTTNVPLAIVLMACAVGLVGMTSAGYNANVLDISPAYTGLIFSMSNTIATIPGIVSPLITEAILHPDGNSASPAPATAWRTVFYLTAGLNVVAAVFYLIFARAHPVPFLKEM